MLNEKLLILSEFYLAGVGTGFILLLLGATLYNRWIGRRTTKHDWKWLVKVSLLSWLAVLFGIYSIIDTIKMKIKKQEKGK